MSSTTFWLTLVGVVLFLVLFVLIGWVIQLLVNVIITPYGIAPFSLGQGLALEVLAGILIGGRKATQ